MKTLGATIWARKTIFSKVFTDKPDKWFKIWFYIVNKANYKANSFGDRGYCFVQSNEIEIATKATKDQVKKCLKWLRDEHSISTHRSTRGIHIRVLNYAIYQDFESYRGTKEALEKHHDKQQSNKDNKQLAPKGAHDDMGWNKESETYDEERVVDLETGEISSPLEEKKLKDKQARESIRKNLLLIEQPRGLKYHPKSLNADIQIYQQLTLAGWSDERIVNEYLDLIGSEYWQSERKKGNFPGMNTVQFSLRNKQPQ